MRIVRYIHPDPYRGVSRKGFNGGLDYRPGERWGVMEGDWVMDLVSHPYDGIETGGAKYHLDDVKLRPPVLPGKIVAVGMNFKGHIREMGHEPPEEPLLFMKAPTAVIGPGENILLPPESERVDYEGELAVVVGKRCRRIDPERAADAVLGYTVLNDVTARDLQKRDVQYTRAKSFDTFCPIGPWIETDIAPGSVKLTTVVNAEVRQEANTSTMLFDPLRLVAYISAAMTLEPGDVIATGTPAGVGPLKEGDTVSVAVEGIGVLSNPVWREEV